MGPQNRSGWAPDYYLLKDARSGPDVLWPPIGHHLALPGGSGGRAGRRVLRALSLDNELLDPCFHALRLRLVEVVRFALHRRDLRPTAFFHHRRYQCLPGSGLHPLTDRTHHQPVRQVRRAVIDLHLEPDQIAPLFSQEPDRATERMSREGHQNSGVGRDVLDPYLDVATHRERHREGVPLAERSRRVGFRSQIHGQRGQLTEAHPEAREQLLRSQRAASYVDPESLPFQQAYAVVGSLFWLCVGQLSESALERRRLDMQYSNERVRSRRGNHVTLTEHDQLAFVHGEPGPEEARNGDTGAGDERRNRYPRRVPARDLAQSVGEIVERRLLLACDLEHATVQICSANALAQREAQIVSPYGLELVVARSEDGKDWKGPDHIEHPRDDIVSRTVHVSRTHNYPPAGKAPHDFLGAALRPMIRRVPGLRPQRRHEYEPPHPTPFGLPN